MGVTVPVPETATVRSRRCTVSEANCPMAGAPLPGPDRKKIHHTPASTTAAAMPRRSHFFPFLDLGMRKGGSFRPFFSLGAWGVSNSWVVSIAILLVLLGGAPPLFPSARR